MLVIYFYATCIMFMALKYGFYCLIACFFGFLLFRIYHYIKALYVLRKIEGVTKIELIKQVQKYRTVYEETGYSSNSQYTTTYYKAKQIPKPLVYKCTAFFENGQKIRFRIVDNSVIFKKLIQYKAA